MSLPKPKSFGLLVYPGFEVLDVFGPLEALNVISRPAFDLYIEGINLSIIAETMEPVSPAFPPKPFGTSAVQSMTPHYTIHDHPKLDVLLIPGGMGSDAVRDGKDQKVVKWVSKICSSLQYLITVCTGAHIAAKAGVLDGLRATTNKADWAILSAPTSTWAHKTFWVAKARWCMDINNSKIWTTSGVSAGTDGFIAWIKLVYGEDVAEAACQWMEYNATTASSDDPWALKLQRQDVPIVAAQESPLE